MGCISHEIKNQEALLLCSGTGIIMVRSADISNISVLCPITIEFKLAITTHPVICMHNLSLEMGCISHEHTVCHCLVLGKTLTVPYQFTENCEPNKDTGRIPCEHVLYELALVNCGNDLLYE